MIEHKTTDASQVVKYALKLAVNEYSKLTSEVEKEQYCARIPVIIIDKATYYEITNTILYRINSLLKASESYPLATYTKPLKDAFGNASQIVALTNINNNRFDLASLVPVVAQLEDISNTVVEYSERLKKQLSSNQSSFNINQKSY